jgi:hypothetical protein
MVIGKYDEKGYQIENEKGHILFEASLESKDCLSLRQIKSSCIQTAKKIAERKGDDFGGAETFRTGNG